MKQSERLMSLDALRGFDMLFIMGFASLVVAVCGLWPSAVTDAAAASMSHVAWDGFAHHDTIFPLFLFIAGVSFPYSVAKQRAGGMSEGRIYAKIVRRGLTLVVLGMVYNGLFKLDFENLRIASVLGRIGLAWSIAAVLYLNFGVKTRAAIAVAVLAGYGALSALVAAPDGGGGEHVGWVHQDAWFYTLDLDKDRVVEYRMNTRGHGAYVFVIEGSVEAAGEELGPRDGMGITGADEFPIKGETDAKVLIIEVPMEV